LQYPLSLVQALFKEDSQLPPLLNVWERDATHVKYQMQLSLGASSSGGLLSGIAVRGIQC